MKKSKFTLLTASLILAIAFTFISCASSAEKAMLALPNVEKVEGLKNKLKWLKENAQSDGNYILEVNADEKLNSYVLNLFDGEIYHGEFTYKGKNNITITLKGIDSMRIINSSSGFVVGRGVTLILDDNITMRNLITVNGTLVMNEGSVITSAYINDFNIFDKTIRGCFTKGGDGVCVDYGGNFIMNGGVISGNTIKQQIFVPSGQHIQKCNMTLGLANSMSNSSVSRSLEKNTLEECSNYPISDLKGAGVYISSGGTFTKTGGTINGYTGDKEKDNVVTDSSGKALQGKGHAIYFDGIEPKAIDTTVGQEMNISFSSGVFKDNSSQP